MRISSKPGDEGYEKYAETKDSHNCFVTLNGAIVRNVIMADEGQGVVEVNRLGSTGRFVVINDLIQSDTLHGTVCITLVPNA